MSIKLILSVLSVFLLGGTIHASLLITEVSFDGTDEFVELYNPGADFSGSLLLEGAKSTVISLGEVHIPSQGFFLIGDTAGMFNGIALQKSGLSLNIVDTAGINLQVKDSTGVVIDSFIVEQNQVQFYDNTKTSFQKYNLDGNIVYGPVLSNQASNAVVGFTIHPGVFISLESPPSEDNSQGTTGEHQTGNNVTPPITGDSSGNNGSEYGDTSTGNNISGDITSPLMSGNTSGTNTGDTITGGNTSNTIQTGGSDIGSPASSTRIFIEEIHPGNDEYFKEYMELWFETAYSGSLRVVGAGHGNSEKVIIVSQPQKSRLLLGGEDFGYGNSIINGLSLTDGGESLSIIGQDGQVIDSVVYNGRNSKKSLYRGESGSGGVIMMNVVDTMTPGYAMEQVRHLLPTGSGSTLPCGIDFQNRVPWYAGTSMNVAALRENTLISNSDTNYVCEWKKGGETISNVCNPNYILFSGAVLDILHLEVRFGNDFCLQSIPLNIPLALSSSSAGVSSSYYEEYKLWKDKYYELLKSIRLLGFDLSTSKLLSLDQRILSAATALEPQVTDFSGSVFLDAILPNNKGKDDFESIRLLSQGSGVVSGLYISFDTSIFLLGDIILEEEVHLFTTGMSLPNNGTCVELKQGSVTLDQLCYPKTKEGVRYTKSGTEDGDGVLLSGSSLGLFSLKQTTKEVCGYLDNQKIFCEPLDRSKKDQKSLESTLHKLEKSLQKKEKEITKLTKKIDTQNTKIVKLTEKQKLIQASVKDIRKKYSERRQKKEATLIATRQKNSNLTALVRLHTSYIGFLENSIYTQRSDIAGDVFHNFTSTRQMHQLLSSTLKHGTQKSFIISPYVYGGSDDLLALAQGEVTENLVTNIVPVVFQQISSDFEQMQQNIQDQKKNFEIVKLGLNK